MAPINNYIAVLSDNGNYQMQLTTRSFRRVDDSVIENYSCTYSDEDYFGCSEQSIIEEMTEVAKKKKLSVKKTIVDKLQKNLELVRWAKKTALDLKTNYDTVSVFKVHVMSNGSIWIIQQNATCVSIRECNEGNGSAQKTGLIKKK